MYNCKTIVMRVILAEDTQKNTKKNTDRYLLRGELAVFLQKNRENSYKYFLKTKNYWKKAKKKKNGNVFIVVLFVIQFLYPRL